MSEAKQEKEIVKSGRSHNRKITYTMIHWPPKFGEILDVVISHNELVSLWYDDPDDPNYSKLLIQCEAWRIPPAYHELQVLRFFGSIREHITESDYINIFVQLPEEGIEKLEPLTVEEAHAINAGFILTYDEVRNRRIIEEYKKSLVDSPHVIGIDLAHEESVANCEGSFEVK